MIIGNGDIAKAIQDRDDVIFFASGVSDSSCKDYHQFEREMDMFKAIKKNKHVVYFSTTQPVTKSSYAIHKSMMELLVRTTHESYTIFKLGNISWGKNPHTFTGYFKKCKRDKIEPEVWNAERSILLREEFTRWVNLLVNPGDKQVIELIGAKMPVCEIWRLIKEGKI